MLWAGVAAVAGLILLVILGPNEQEIKDRFEYYGAPGELKIMPEISIEEGNQDIHQIPRSLLSQPPPSNIEIEKEDPTEKGTEFIPRSTSRNRTTQRPSANTRSRIRNFHPSRRSRWPGPCRPTPTITS
jgi:hypothetical protein